MQYMVAGGLVDGDHADGAHVGDAVFANDAGDAGLVQGAGGGGQRLQGLVG